MGHIRHALRFVGRQPAFSGAVVLMLALGVGGATAMFSIVRAVLLKPLPYERPGELVWMFGSFSQADSAAVSPPDFLDYRARSTAFSSLGAMVIGPQSVTVVHPSGPERLNAATVSAGLITTLGVPLTLGRDFRRDEERGASAVIISDRVWREHFHGAPDVLGQPLRVDERIRTIVGIAPPRFALPFDPFIRLTDPVDLYVPISLDDAEAQVRRFHFLRLIGRLAPGVTLSRAQSQMDVIARQLEAAYPENKTWKLRLLPLHERLVATCGGCCSCCWAPCWCCSWWPARTLPASCSPAACCASRRLPCGLRSVPRDGSWSCTCSPRHSCSPRSAASRA